MGTKMVSVSMITPFSSHRFARVGGALGVLSLCVLTTACNKVPLLAPTGSSITLTASATVLPVNGTTQLIAQVLEAAGTPPQNGTLVKIGRASCRERVEISVVGLALQKTTKHAALHS